MDKQSIGILLSWKEWKKLIQNKNFQDYHFKYYVEIGDQLNATLIFFPINKFNVEKSTSEAAIAREKTIAYIGNTAIPPVIYCPMKFNRRENIRKLREISQQTNTQVINEHHIIKKKDFYRLISSFPELKDFADKDGEAHIISFYFYILGQKNIDDTWEITALYAKDKNNTILSFHDACRLIFVKEEMIVSAEEIINALFKKVFLLIKFYYPGVFELGIQFRWTVEGNIVITSTCPINKIRNDLYQWNQEIFASVVQQPVKTAFGLLTKTPKQLDFLSAVDLKDSQNIAYPQGFLRSMNEPSKKEFHYWVKFEPFEEEKTILRIPAGVFPFTEKQTGILHFGVKEVKFEYAFEQTILHEYNNSFSNPLKIKASTALLEEMSIPLDIIYQLKYAEESFILGPTIGFVLGEKNHLYNPDFMKKYCDRFGKYESFGGLVLAFSPRSVDWRKKVAYGMIYNIRENKWMYSSGPIPSVLYRRNFHQDAEKIQRLIDMTNNRFFNSHHFKKSDLFLLQNEPAIKRHLPATFLLKDIPGLIYFSKNNNKVILKPVDLSRGRGIYILEKPVKQEGFILYESRNKFRIRHHAANPFSLEEIMKSLGVFNKNYLFQKYIPLLRVDQRPFDVRIVMQKYDIKKWKCTGMECRIASKNEDITNIARGGKAMALEEIIREHTNFSYIKLQRKILRLSQKFCSLIEKKGYHFAEFGIDIALDEKGFPWFLEANVFPSFKGFKDLDYETYLQIRYQPLFYSVRLQGFKTKEEMVHEVYN